MKKIIIFLSIFGLLFILNINQGSKEIKNKTYNYESINNEEIISNIIKNKKGDLYGSFLKIDNINEMEDDYIVNLKLVEINNAIIKEYYSQYSQNKSKDLNDYLLLNEFEQKKEKEKIRKDLKKNYKKILNEGIKIKKDLILKEIRQ